ncbi:hypothetical protein O181_072452 [Austropuccinia psidii MF-1]|uniref:Uncharacterized protein n=1 Tax=Austropuccinia psidii MF-1 TaxID=1389203 RepID=A0A9Q3IA54_9BASI|nr:hypothetical protein [Austropuccinia psidii MF-1]
MEYKDHEGYDNDWVTLLPAVKLAYNEIQHSITGKSPFLIDKGCSLFLPVDHLEKDLLAIYPILKDLHESWKKVCDTEQIFIAEAKEYEKQRYKKNDKETDFRDGDQALV